MIRFHFDASKPHWGVVDVDGSTIQLGEDAFKPYDLTLGALCGCYSATIWEMAENQHVHLPHFMLKIEGEKRKTIPTTLAMVSINISMDEVEPTITRILVDSAASCSMMATIACVADITIALNGQTIVKLDHAKQK